MCFPIGIEWRCGCDYRTYWRCAESQSEPCGMEQLIYATRGLPPALYVPHEPAVEALWDYQHLAKAFQTHLRLTYCCSPECCQRALHSLLQQQNRDAARSIEEVNQHVSTCLPRFCMRLGKLNTMRRPDEPRRLGLPPLEATIRGLLTPKENKGANLAQLRKYTNLYNAGEGLNSNEQGAFNQYITIRYYTLANWDTDVLSGWRPSERLRYEFNSKVQEWWRYPILQRDSLVTWAGTINLDAAELQAQADTLQLVVTARQTAGFVRAVDHSQIGDGRNVGYQSLYSESQGLQPADNHQGGESQAGPAGNQYPLQGIGLHDSGPTRPPRPTAGGMVPPPSGLLLTQPANLQQPIYPQYSVNLQHAAFPPQSFNTQQPMYPSQSVHSNQHAHPQQHVNPQQHVHPHSISGPAKRGSTPGVSRTNTNSSSGSATASKSLSGKTGNENGKKPMPK